MEWFEASVDLQQVVWSGLKRVCVCMHVALSRVREFKNLVIFWQFLLCSGNAYLLLINIDLTCEKCVGLLLGRENVCKFLHCYDIWSV